MSVKRALLLSLLGGILMVSARAGEPAVTLSGDWQQGALIFGKAPAGTQIAFNGHAVRVSPEGLFVIGLDRDEPASAELSVQLPGAEPQVEKYTVSQRKYQIQQINGLPPDKVNPPAQLLERIEREQALVRKARLLDTPGTDFAQPFMWPCLGRISGVFGSQRILNGEKKQPHYGVDVAVPNGTAVRAPAGGVVSLAEPDLYYTGGTLMIDHGHGLASAFLHLSKLKVKVGDVVRQGDIVALSGTTGRSTGPHLDWRVNWLDARVDAEKLVPAMQLLDGAKKKK